MSRGVVLFGRLLRGLAALAILLALVGGIPAVLWVLVGWPLPHALTTVAELRHALTDTGIPDAVLINILALGCWAAWAVFAAATVVEAAAAVRGRAARRIPLAGQLQALAGSLVAAILLTFLTMIVRTQAADGAGTSLAALAVAEPAGLALPGPAALASPSPVCPPPPAQHRVATTHAPLVPSPPPAPRRYIVKSRDTLWGIADRELGDPFRWQEIYRRNHSRTQPDGGALTDPDLIRPGWILELPPATSPSRRDGAPAKAPTSPPTRPAPALRPQHGAQQNEAPPPTTTAPAASSTTRAESQADEHRRDRQLHAPTHPTSPTVELPSGAIVGLSLAAGVTLALAAARLHQRRRRPLGEPHLGISHADPLATPTVRRLRRAAITMQTSSDADAVGDDAPAPTERITANRSSVALDTPATDPTAAMAGHHRLGVVGIGVRADREVTADLTRGGIALAGVAAVDAARSILVALLAGAGPQADAVEVSVVGDPLAAQLLDPADAVPGLRVVPDLDAALSSVEAEMVHRLRLLQGLEAADLASYLAVDPAEPLPVIVLVADLAGESTGSRQRLAAVLTVGRRLGIGAVLLGPAAGIPVPTVTLGARGEVHAVPANGALADLVPPSRAFTLGRVEAHELLAVVAAGRGAPPPPTASPSTPSPDVADLPAAATAQAPPDPGVAPDQRPIHVRCFGPLRIEVQGAEIRTGLRSKARELLAFLLLRPTGVARETAVEALWPDMDPARSAERAKDAVKSLRRVLRAATGQAGSGATVVELIGERWRINPELVDCDVWRFQAALTAAAAATDEATRRAALTTAVATYGGTLLEDTDYHWVEEAREELRRQAADLAGRLGELREHAGDLDGALAALEDGARWDAYNEELYQRIMRLQARLGRLDAVRRTYTRLQERLADLGVDPDDVSERLFQELRRGSGTRR